jgi:putative flippase GtrA
VCTAGTFQTVLQRRGVRQFVKFCIVGASSTLIDFGIYLLLVEVLRIGQYLPGPVVTRTLAQSISFAFAVTNGFFWNNRWTFRAGDAAGAHARYVKFVTTNLIGLGLNLAILNAVAHLLPDTLTLFHLHDPRGFVGKLCATAFVVFWNFTASKYWTFKR